MCTIAILIGVTDQPVVIAANRDEVYARPTRPPETLGARIVGGRDVLSGGTWLALRDDGRFAAVTNQHVLEPPPPGLRSRGLAVTECASAEDQDAYVRALDPRGYASMNLVYGDAHGVTIAYLRREDGSRDHVKLGRGVHVLCNDRLGAPGFPRGERLRRMIERALAETTEWTSLWPKLAIALGDHERVAIDAVPPSRFPVELARELTSICIHSPYYGTRSSSLIALQSGRVAAYLACDGPPGETPFTDRSGLLGS